MLKTFRNLTEREQILIVALAALLALLLLVFGVIRPVLGFAASSERAFLNANRLAAMTENLDEPGAENTDDRALRTVVTQLADRRKIVYTRINQGADGSLQVDLQDVPHAAFFGWLEQLDREADIVVSSAFVAPGDKSQTVEARLTFVRAEGR